MPNRPAICVGCGCSDDRACEGGCSWLAVDRGKGIGVCSRCANGRYHAANMLAHRAAVNPRRRLKKQLMRKHGITTGRQLAKLRRRLRQEGRARNA